MNRFSKFILVLISLSATITAKTTFKQRREWIIGQYSGFYKDTTNNGPWIPIVFDINYSTNIGNIYMDSTCFVAFSGEDVFIYPDSSFALGAPNDSVQSIPQNNYFWGKLYADSTFIHWYTTVNWPTSNKKYYFQGKKNLTFSTNNIANETKKIVHLPIYPNPAHNFIQFDLLNTGKNDSFYYKIYSINGAILQEAIVTDDRIIDIKKIDSGIYYLVVTNKLNHYKSVFIKY